MVRPINSIVMFDQENDDEIINNSPINLIVGGRARLVRLAKIHHEAITGSMVCKPRARIIVRL